MFISHVLVCIGCNWVTGLKHGEISPFLFAQSIICFVNLSFKLVTKTKLWLFYRAQTYEISHVLGCTIGNIL